MSQFVPQYTLYHTSLLASFPTLTCTPPGKLSCPVPARGRASSPALCLLGLAHLQPSSPGSVLLCFLSGVLEVSHKECSWLGTESALLLSCPQGQLSLYVQVRGGINTAQPSDINTSLGGNPDQGCQPGPLLVTQPSMSLGNSTGQGPTMVPGGIIGFPHQSVPHPVSSSACLCCAPILLAPLSGTGVSECHGSYQECTAPFVHYDTGHGSLGMEDASPTTTTTSDW